MMSPVKNPQVVGVYATIWDDPSKPFRVEALHVPLRPRGDAIRQRYELLSVQLEIDVVIIGGRDKILLNERLRVPDTMRRANEELLRALEAADGQEIAMPAVMNALDAHQRQVSHPDVRY